MATLASDVVLVNGEEYVILHYDEDDFESKEAFLDCVEETYGGLCTVYEDEVEVDDLGEYWIKGDSCNAYHIRGSHEDAVFVRKSLYDQVNSQHLSPLYCPEVVAWKATEEFDVDSDLIREAVKELGYGTLHEVRENRDEVLYQALKKATDPEDVENILSELSMLDSTLFTSAVTKDVWSNWPWDAKIAFLETIPFDDLDIPDYITRWVEDNVPEVPVEIALSYLTSGDEDKDAETVDKLLAIYPLEKVVAAIPKLVGMWPASDVGSITARALDSEEKRRKALEILPLKNATIKEFLEEPEFQTVRAQAGATISMAMREDISESFSKEQFGITTLGGSSDTNFLVYAYRKGGNYVELLPLVDIKGRKVDYNRDRFFCNESSVSLAATVYGLLQDPPVHPYLDVSSLLDPDLRDLYRYAVKHKSLPPHFSKLVFRAHDANEISPGKLAVLAAVVERVTYNRVDATERGKYRMLLPGETVTFGTVPGASSGIILTISGPKLDGKGLVLRRKDDKAVPSVLWDPNEGTVVPNWEAIAHGYRVPHDLLKSYNVITVSKAFFV